MRRTVVLLILSGICLYTIIGYSEQEELEENVTDEVGKNLVVFEEEEYDEFLEDEPE